MIIQNHIDVYKRQEYERPKHDTALYFRSEALGAGLFVHLVKLFIILCAVSCLLYTSNYQISQLYLPIARDGYVEIEVGEQKKKVRIHEMHMEEDAGKLIHDEWEDCSLVDYNRSGVPLIEIVSEPDMRSADEVIAYLEKLRMICQYLGASDCKLQEGSMRADVNLSVREVGASEFGTRTEMKNLNSFKAITHAIEGERQRQIELIEEGKKVIQETRRWDDNKEYSYAMRSKEDAQDYR